MHERVMLLIGMLLVLAGCASGGASGASADDQLRLGVKAAERGYWQEALFRFQRAGEARPGNVEILNNVAVALEALGRYDEALDTYKRALELAPRNTTVRRNYARFAEFFTSYARGVKPKGETGETR